MAHDQTPTDGACGVRLRLDLSSETVEVDGPTVAEGSAVAAELKARLGALVDAKDSGDAEAFAAAVAAVNGILDRVEIEWVMGGRR